MRRGYTISLSKARARPSLRRASSTTTHPEHAGEASSKARPQIVQPTERDTAVASPISAEAFAAAMSPLKVQSGQALAVGVSGGPDSLALLLLLQQWAKPNNVRVVGITVDHRFREESAEECRIVGDWLQNRGLEHASCVITWDRNMTPGQKQNMARVERYKLLVSTAQNLKADAVCVAHHKDDQIETFLMRFSLMSGLDGLACMGPRRLMNRFPLLRPLLAFPKTQLRATCAAFGHPYIEDPSNSYEFQLRTRSRTFISSLSAQGFETEDLLPVIGRLSELRESSAMEVDAFLTDRFNCDPTLGFGTTRRSFLRSLSRPILQRVLVRLLMYYGGRVYPPSLFALESLTERILSNDRDFPAFTASGCYVFQDLGRAPTLYFASEAVSRKFRGIPIASGQTVTVDNVWRVSYRSESGEPAAIVYLDHKIWSMLIKKIPRLVELQRLPPRCRMLPILLSADCTKPLAIPYENVYMAKGITAEITFAPPMKLLHRDDHSSPPDEIR